MKVYGVGVNDAGYKTQEKGVGYTCPYYLKWRNMLQRCYSKNCDTGSSVSEDWLVFSNFRKWLVSFNIDKEKLHSLHLDKDLLCRGNKIYSEETCCLLHPKVNTFLNTTDGDRGVCWHKNRGYYVIQCKNPFTRKTEYLGKCCIKEDGYPVWLKRKRELAKELSDSIYMFDEKTKLAILNHFKTD